jgi:pimeloyl-ACP methyl ester carboxylesterase/quercetin dioxygenase-like cupin family protein
MNVGRRAAVGSLVSLVLVVSVVAPAEAQQQISIAERVADVNGVRLHYLVAGKGDPVILLHGYAETSHMWRPLIEELARTQTVVAPDLRGFDRSSKPDGGYDKKTMAQDVHALAVSLGIQRAKVVGHDIGLMVAYAYAAQYPTEVDRLVLMDAFLPGVGDWESVWLLRDLWHFHFYGEVPLKLVAGRERIYFEHFWNDFAADPRHSVREVDRQFYAAAYARPGGMRAGFEVFRAFAQDAKDFAQFAKVKLTMPMLVLSGEKASGEFLIQQGRLVADNVEGVIVKGSGHWLMEEAPDQVIPKLVEFLTRAQTNQRSSPTRLTPREIADLAQGGPGAGTSGVAGIRTTVLEGDPTKAGLYTIRLHVPANTRIEAHTHRDNRSATVVSGTWYLGYGGRFDVKALKALPPGSFYTEPPGELHFAQTRAEPVVLHITGYGPTDTIYAKKVPSAGR